MVSAILLAGMLQSAAINSGREAYLGCLKADMAAAKTAAVAVDGYETHARSSCASIESSFKSAMVAFDVHNKVARARASSDAQAQIDEFMGEYSTQYKGLVGAK